MRQHARRAAMSRESHGSRPSPAPPATELEDHQGEGHVDRQQAGEQADQSSAGARPVGRPRRSDRSATNAQNLGGRPRRRLCASPSPSPSTPRRRSPASTAFDERAASNAGWRSQPVEAFYRDSCRALVHARTGVLSGTDGATIRRSTLPASRTGASEQLFSDRGHRRADSAGRQRTSRTGGSCPSAVGLRRRRDRRSLPLPAAVASDGARRRASPSASLASDA